MGRDCSFSGILCGLGVGEGTRLLFFRVLSSLGAGEGTRLSLPFQVRPAFGGRLAYRALFCYDEVAVLPLYSRRWEWRNGMLVLQDGIAAVKCKALSPWAL